MLRILTARKNLGNTRTSMGMWVISLSPSQDKGTNEESIAIALNRWFDFDEKPGLFLLYWPVEIIY
jgi:hypothetical protein